MRRSLNCRGMHCPKPLVELAREMKTMDSSELLEVVATDPAFWEDIKAWCNQTQNQLVNLEQKDLEIIAVIRKK